MAGLPEGFQTHIIWAFSARAKKQDQVLGRLALYLDPRFRQAALRGDGNLMCDFGTAATTFGHAQGWPQEKLTKLLEQLGNYGDYKPPFNQPCDGSCRSWWSNCGKNEDGAALAELAGVLFDVVPHAAAPERVFSLMGWYEGATSSSMVTSTTAKKVAIKMHFDAVDPPKRRYEGGSWR